MKTNKNLLISACLVGDKCRYDGKDSFNADIADEYKKGSAVKCCPEVCSGLSTPRNPVEIVGGDGFDVMDGKAKVVDKNGNDYTKEFLIGANKTLELCQKYEIKKAVLKANSPSCGYKKIYDGSFSMNLISGAGVTAALLKRNGIEIETV